MKNHFLDYINYEYSRSDHWRRMAGADLPAAAVSCTSLRERRGYGLIQAITVVHQQTRYLAALPLAWGRCGMAIGVGHREVSDVLGRSS